MPSQFSTKDVEIIYDEPISEKVREHLLKPVISTQYLIDVDFNNDELKQICEHYPLGYIPKDKIKMYSDYAKENAHATYGRRS